MTAQREDQPPDETGARGAEALMRRILLDAIRTLDGSESARGTAAAWIAAVDDEWPLSFQNICEGLGIEPGPLRWVLLGGDRGPRGAGPQDR